MHTLFKFSAAAILIASAAAVPMASPASASDSSSAPIASTIPDPSDFIDTVTSAGRACKTGSTGFAGIEAGQVAGAYTIFWSGNANELTTELTQANLTDSVTVVAAKYSYCQLEHASFQILDSSVGVNISGVSQSETGDGLTVSLKSIPAPGSVEASSIEAAVAAAMNPAVDFKIASTPGKSMHLAMDTN